MPQLPTVGGDDGVWGTYLNDFLSVSLDSDNVTVGERGKLRPSAVDAAGAVMNTDTTTSAMSFVVDEDNMASDSASKVPTQQSVKAYVDSSVTGSGSIVGPASSTDNAVVRYDGITGKLAQDSTVTIGDTGNVAISGTTITLNSLNMVSSSGNLNLTDFNSAHIRSVRNDNGNLATIAATKVLEWSSNTSNPSVLITPTGTSQKAAVVKGLASQTGNLQEWQDSSGAPLMSVSSAGTLTTTSPVINTGVSGTAIDTDGTLTANSDTKIPSQKAIKTYVDTTSATSSSIVVQSKNSNYSVVATDDVILVDATSGNVTIDVITAVGRTRPLSIKKIDSSVNTVIVDAAGSETIDGGATAVLTSQYESITLVSNNSNYFIT